MPPWSSRLLSPGFRHESDAVINTNSPSFSSSPSPARPRTRLTESDILDNAYGIPSLAPPNGSSRTPSHGRSMSHPFPSLFTGKKKRDEGESAATAGFDSTDSDSVSPANKAKTKVQDKNLRTGKCMTCDATVRWPKELKVFRCTKCVTINDLRHGDGQRVPVVVKAGTYPGTSFQQKGMVDLN
jgi:E3 ubiquitin-protein ligase HECTD2